MIQYLILFTGILLILSNLDIAAIGRKTISLFNSAKSAVSDIHVPDIHIPRPSPTPYTPPAPEAPVKPVSREHSLVELVEDWEIFKQSCEDNNLADAVAKLDEIFPMLIKAKEKEVTNEKS